MADTMTFEDATTANPPADTLSFEEATLKQSPDTLTFEQAAPAQDLSKFTLSPADRFAIQQAAPGANRYSYGPGVPISLNPDWDFVRATHGDAMLAVPLAIGAKMAGSKDPEAFPFKPLATLPKVSPEDMKLLPTWARHSATVVNQINGTLEQFLSPEQIAQLPALEAKGVQAMYLAQIAANTPELIQNIRDAKTPDDRLAAQTQLGIHLGMAGLMAKGVTAKEIAKLPEKIPVEWREIQPVQPVQTPERAAPAYSEFGGEIKEEPVSAEALPRQAEAPVPETSATIAAQVAATKDPETPKAVTLVTPGAEVPDEHGLVPVETSQGTALVNPEKADPVQAKEQLDAGAGGQLLGMSTEQKPEGGTAVLQTKTEDGTPVQDEVVTPATLPAAAEAGRKLAPTGTQELRTPEAVIAERNARPLSTIERKYLGEDMKAREPLRADVVRRATEEGGFALPAGYELQGDKFIFKEPAAAETAAMRDSREQRETMAAIRGQRAEGSQPTEAPRPSNPTDRPEPGTPIPTFERPPDVLDDIENHVGGVSIPEKADFAEHRAAVKELSQSKAADLGGTRLKALFRGTAPDRALNTLHHEGLQLRVTSGEELVDEMVRAAKARLAWAEQEKAAAKFEAPPAEKDPWQATIDKLNSLKADTSGQLHAFGLLPEAWNQLIELVKLGVKGGKALADAVDWAIGKFKEQAPGIKFDEPGAREHLNENLKESNLTGRLMSDPTVSDAVKAAVDPLYEQKPLATSAQQANAILQARGLDGAIAEHNGNPNLPEDVRVALGAFIDEHMRTEAGVARASGKTKLAELWEQRQVDFFNQSFRPQGTELGRAVNAFKLFGANSAHTWLKQYNDALMSAIGNRFDRVKSAADTVISTLRQANIEAFNELQTDGATNAGARGAVDEAITKSPAVHQAVIMDLAGPWSESPEIVRMAREQVRAKADELLNRGPRPVGLNPAQHLRVLMDDLAKRAADIASGHYQGAEPGVILRDKLMQRLGLGVDAATRLAKRLDDEFARQMESAKSQLDKRIATVRARQGVLREATQKLNAERRAFDAANKTVREAAARVAQEDAARRVAETAGKRTVQKVQETAATRALDAANKTLREAAARAAKAESELRVKQAEMMKWSSVEKRIHQELRDWNEKLGAIVQKLPSAQEAQGKLLTERLVEASGLTGPKADKFRALLQSRWEAIVSAKKQAMLEQLTSPSARKLLAKPGLADRLIKYSNLGAFENEKVYNLVKEKLKLPTYDPAAAREITKRANELQQMPRGSLQQAKGAEELMTFIAHQQGMKAWEMAQSYWYSNLLSGLTTQAKVAIYNLSSIGAHTFTQMVQHPTAIPQIIEALGRAIPKGVDTAGAILRDGTVPGIGVKMFEHGHGIERWSGVAGKIAWPWKVMLRALGAQHLVLFKPAAEIKALVLARAMAKTEGAVDTATRAREILGWTDQARSAAEAQAEAEGLKGIDYRRRVQEILEQARPPQLQAAATEWAKRASAVAEPYGILGALTHGFDTAAKSAPILNLIVPFRKIVANVANDALGWTPLGWAERMLEYRRKGTMFGNEVNADQLADTHAQAIIGTVGLTALAYAAANGTVTISAQGPATPEQRKTLHSTTGWTPYSIKIGDHYISYMDRPAEIPLAIIGHYMDAMKYQKLDQEDALNRVAYATLGARSVVLDSGWLQGLAGVFSQADAYTTKNASERIGTQFAKTASGFVPMSQMVKQIDRLFDPQVYDADGIRAKFLMQLPFVRKQGQPVLNRFGQPITSSPLDQFVTKEKPDPIVSLLIAKKALPSDISKGELTNDEYYLLVKRAGPMFYRSLVDNASQIAGKSDRDAKALVEKLSTETTGQAKQGLGLDTVERLRKQF